MPERTAQTDAGIRRDAVVTPPHEQADIASTAARGRHRNQLPSQTADGADAAGADTEGPAKSPGGEASSLPAAGVEHGWQQVSSALQQVSDGLWDTDISSSEHEDDLSDGDFADGIGDGVQSDHHSFKRPAVVGLLDSTMRCGHAMWLRYVSCAAEVICFSA